MEIAPPAADGDPAVYRARGVWLLVLVWFAVLLGIVAQSGRYFGDEHFYTDAAIRMAQGGDYWIPHSADDNAPRFNKPIFTYWALAASYKLFGISMLTSRLPFLVAGCGLLWLTYRLSLALFRREEDAFLSAVILFSNFVLYSSSTRSTPDIYQCLFLTTSLYGFMNIVLRREKTTVNYFCAWVGAALAIETKGIPGLFPILFTVAFCLWRGGRRGSVRDLFEWKSITLALVIGLSWFVVIYAKYGMTALVGDPKLNNGFLADQVTDNLGGAKFNPLRNLLYYLHSPAMHFLPWLVFALSGLLLARAEARQFWREHKETCLYILGWVLVFYLIFSLSRTTRGRYLFPTYPMISILLSSALSRMTRNARLNRLIGHLCLATLVLGTGCAVLLAVVGAWIHPWILWGGVVTVVAMLALLLLAARGDLVRKCLALSLFCLVMFAGRDYVLKPVFEASPAPIAAQRILDEKLDHRKFATVGPDHCADRIRVLSGGRISGTSLTDKAQFDEIDRYSLVLVSQPFREKWNPTGWRFVACGYEYDSWGWQDLQDLIRSRDKNSVYERKKIPCFLAIRESAGS